LSRSECLSMSQRRERAAIPPNRTKPVPLDSAASPHATAIDTMRHSRVDAVTRSLAKELGPRRIRVNVINPDMVETEGVHAAGLSSSDFRKTARGAHAACPDRPCNSLQKALSVKSLLCLENGGTRPPSTCYSKWRLIARLLGLPQLQRNRIRALLHRVEVGDRRGGF
jgi:Enoyl-(Acyl carrier protein) reductase